MYFKRLHLLDKRDPSVVSIGYALSALKMASYLSQDRSQVKPNPAPPGVAINQIQQPCLRPITSVHLWSLPIPAFTGRRGGQATFHAGRWRVSEALAYLARDCLEEVIPDPGSKYSGTRHNAEPMIGVQQAYSSFRIGAVPARIGPQAFPNREILVIMGEAITADLAFATAQV